jgi:hypothetical protein
VALRIVRPPVDGIWRVARAPDPLAQSKRLGVAQLDSPTTGNRFDSPDGGYGVLYFATTLDGCYGETLARFRPDPRVQAVASQEWRERGFMDVGDVPADWRQRRVAVRVEFVGTGMHDGAEFLDVESLETREELRTVLAPTLAAHGFRDLDVATVRGADRRVTRAISQWAYEQRGASGGRRFAGIRYLSRLESGWECWAVFGDVGVQELQRRPILLTDEALKRVARAYKLKLH